MDHNRQDLELAKAKAMPVGTVSNGRIKMADGSWKWISTRKTKEEKKVESIKDQISETKAKIAAIDEKKKQVEELQAKKDAATAKRKEAEKKIAESTNKINELKSKLDNVGKKKSQSVTSEEVAAIDEYKKGMYNSEIGGFSTIQGILRDGKSKFGDVPKKDVQPYIDNLSSAINKSPLKSDTKVYRGLKAKEDASAKIYDLKVGDTYKDPAFTSTSSSNSVANKFAEKLNRSDKPIKLVYDLPAGYPALKVKDHLSGPDKEKELILDKGTEFEVISVVERSGVKQITLRPKSVEKSMTDQLKMALDALEKSKKYPIGTVRNGRKKVAEGKWVAENEAGQGQPKGNIQEVKEEEKPSKETLTAQQHKEESNRHFDMAMEYSDYLNKMQDKINERRKIDKKYKVPAKAQRLMDMVKEKVKFHKKLYNEHKSQSIQNYKTNKPKANKYMANRAEGAQSSLDQKRNEKKVTKSMIAVDDQGSAVETANYNIDLEQSDFYLDQFYGTMEDYNYGDAPRQILLDNGYSIILSKVDDGLYSGFVRQTTDWDGDSPLEETVGKVEKQTIPAIISYLKAKEFIKPMPCKLAEALDAVPVDPEPSPEVIQEIAEATLEGVASSEEVPTTQDRVLAMQLINLLDRLI